MKIIRLDGRRDFAEVHAAIFRAFQRLRLDAAEHRRTARLVAVGVGVLGDDVFVATLAVGEQRHQIALGAGGKKQRGFVAGHFREFLLEPPHRRVFVIYIIADLGGGHGAAHVVAGGGNGVAAQVNYGGGHGRGHGGSAVSRNGYNTKATAKPMAK